jgi:hypothetical protein
MRRLTAAARPEVCFPQAARRWNLPEEVVAAADPSSLPEVAVAAAPCIRLEEEVAAAVVARSAVAVVAAASRTTA